MDVLAVREATRFAINYCSVEEKVRGSQVKMTLGIDVSSLFIKRNEMLKISGL